MYPFNPDDHPYNYKNLTIKEALDSCIKLQKDLEDFEKSMAHTDSFDDKFLKDEIDLFNSIEANIPSIIRLTKRFNKIMEKRQCLR